MPATGASQVHLETHLGAVAASSVLPPKVSKYPAHGLLLSQDIGDKGVHPVAASDQRESS